MNLLLVDPTELEGDCVTVDGRRATHLRDVLGAVVGSHVKAGVIGGRIGTAEVIADDGARIALRIACTEAAPRPLAVEVVLAVPRPKVLTRTLEAIASFGAERIVLTNAWRVDKSYLSSPRLEPAALAHATQLGAEQGVTTHVPEVVVYRRLMELLDTRWPPGNMDARTKLVAHPAAAPIETAFGAAPIETAVGAAPITLAIGPEGGWIQRELDTFVDRGFSLVSLGAPVLRVETAVAAALAQIVLLQRLTAAR